MSAVLTEHKPQWLARARSAPLFEGFSTSEIEQVCRCLGVRVQHFSRSEHLVTADPKRLAVGLVLEGSVFTAAVDPSGTRHLVAAVNVGDVFGEDVLFAGSHHADSVVTAAAPGSAMIIGMGKIVNAAGPLCHLRSRIVENLLHIMATKNLALQNKLQMVATKSLRDRISLFLAQQADSQGGNRFTIAFSRSELADYLNADRAALSRELARMQSEGLIAFHRNSFVLFHSAVTASAARGETWGTEHIPSSLARSH